MAPGMSLDDVHLTKEKIDKEISQTETNLILDQKNNDSKNQEMSPIVVPKVTYKLEFVWTNIIIFAYLHLACLYAFYLVIFSAQWKTIVFAWFGIYASGLGITAGAHRLWTHRAYKAKTPLKLILCVLQTLAFQNHIYEWSRDHRVHHKFTETDADPHNAKRGFFFSHIGWLMVKKHPDVKEKGKTVDMTDLKEEPIVMFQKRHYAWMMPLISFILPTLIPWYFWNETLWNSWHVASVWRYTITLNLTWMLNSFSHMYGYKPYDKNIGATDDWKLGVGTMGEGWHNYHHVFPWDYKADELGNYKANITTAFLDFFALIGWAYDMKVVPHSVVRKRILRTGDGSHKISKEHSHERQLWGWGDQDMTPDDKECVDIINKLD